jgi:hypothetical protein
MKSSENKNKIKLISLRKLHKKCMKKNRYFILIEYLISYIIICKVIDNITIKAITLFEIIIIILFEVNFNLKYIKKQLIFFLKKGQEHQVGFQLLMTENQVLVFLFMNLKTFKKHILKTFIIFFFSNPKTL